MVDVLTIRSGVREAFETFGTLKRLLARVQTTMLRQVVLVLESLVAVGAFVRPGICNKTLILLVIPNVYRMYVLTHLILSMLESLSACLN